MIPYLVWMGWLGILLLLSFSIGHFLLFRRIPEDRRLEGILFSTGIGIGLLGLLVLFCLVLHRLPPRLFQVASVALALPAAVSLWSMKPFGKVKRPSPSPLSNFFTVLLFLLGITAGLNFLSCLAPVLGNDPLVYHLALPKAYLREGSLFYLPLTHWGYPQLIEMLYTWAFLVSDPPLAQLIHWSFGLLTVFALIQFGKRHLSLKTGVLAAVLFYSMIMVPSLSVYADTDLGFAFFQWMALYAFVNWTHSDSRRDLMASAMFAGFAAGCKYPGALCIPVLLLAVLVRCLTRRGKPSSLLEPFLFFALAGLVTSPWYLKNWLLTGNPVWPYLSHLFPSRDVDPSLLNLALHDYSRSFVPRTLWNALLFPLRVTVEPQSFDGWAHAVGPLLVGLFPLIGTIRKVPKVLWGLSAYAYFLLLVVFSTVQICRYALPAWTCLSVVSAFACLHCLETRGRVTRFLVGGMVLLASCVSLLFAGAYLAYRLPVVIGREQESAFLSRRLDLFDTLTYANRNLEAGSRIVSLDAQVFYSDRPIVTMYPKEQWWLRFNDFADASSLAAFLKERGFSHFLYSENHYRRKEEEFSLAGFSRLWPDLKSNYLEEIFSKHGATLYRIK